MGLILCDSREVFTPYYIPELGINIYSLEELCYLIVNYPYISLDNFADDDLIRFANDELYIPVQKGTNDEVILSILYFSDYYRNEEIDRFRETISEMRKLDKYDFLNRKGDFLFSIEKYGKADSYYKSSLNLLEFSKADSRLKGSIWKKRGCCLANMFETDEAFDAFRTSYELNNDKEVLKYIYFLTKEQNNIELKKQYLNFLDDRVNEAWDREYENTLSEANTCRDCIDTERRLDTDSIRKHKLLGNIILDYKSRYRTML